MTHADPAAGGKSAPGFITIGEIMLRLTPPNYDKMQTANASAAAAISPTARQASWI